MHWHVAGAEALLGLRSVAENGDWEVFQAFRREQEQVRLYGKCLDGDVATIEIEATRARVKGAERQVA